MLSAINTAQAGAVAPSLNHFTYDASNPNPVNPASFTFPSVTDYDTFLAYSQTLEDTGVRAYKGAAPSLQALPVSNSTPNPYLTAALNIHSVEARHASHIRRVRRNRSAAPASGAIKPWITGTMTYITTPNVSANYGAGSPAASYPAEDNTIQGTVNITTLAGLSGMVAVNAATEAFDEPLDPATVVSLVTPFIAKS